MEVTKKYLCLVQSPNSKRTFRFFFLVFSPYLFWNDCLWCVVEKGIWLITTWSLPIYGKSRRAINWFDGVITGLTAKGPCTQTQNYIKNRWLTTNVSFFSFYHIWLIQICLQLRPRLKSFPPKFFIHERHFVHLKNVIDNIVYISQNKCEHLNLTKIHLEKYCGPNG